MTLKSIEERIRECAQLKTQLRELEIEKHPDMAHFNACVQSFVRDGVGASDKMMLPTIGRVFEFTLSTQAHVHSTAILRGASCSKGLHVDCYK